MCDVPEYPCGVYLSLPVGCLTSNVNTAALFPAQGSKATGFGTSILRFLKLLDTEMVGIWLP